MTILHPGWSSLSCDDCTKYIVDKDGYPDRDTSLRGYGRLKLRPKNTVTPCHQCPKTHGSPRRTREHAQEPTERSRRCYKHYMECAATGHFPDDPLVRYHAGIIKTVIESIARGKDNMLHGLMMNLAAALTAGASPVPNSTTNRHWRKELEANG